MLSLDTTDVMLYTVSQLNDGKLHSVLVSITETEISFQVTRISTCLIIWANIDFHSSNAQRFAYLKMTPTFRGKYAAR